MSQIEPMDIDSVESDFDNKENSFHHNNMLPQTPCTEKGYEELDVSELNMKLRYSITPASSPMSKSFTANCLDNRSFDSENFINNVAINDNGNLTRSFNSTIPRNDAVKSLKLFPLQVISTEQMMENRSTTTLRLRDSASKSEDNNVTITLSGPNDNDDNGSLPSPSSSVNQTPEATTPTKEIPKHDGGSPIMRGLKSVLKMFRSSQSPIPPPDSCETKQEVLSCDSVLEAETPIPQLATASTPIANKNRECGSQRSSPLKESIVFSDDLERELEWKDETTILFKEEKIPIHKLFLPHTVPSVSKIAEIEKSSKIEHNEILNTSVEYMDISNNNSVLENKFRMNIQPTGISNTNEILPVESDGEFVDCETTLNDEVIDSKVADKERNISNNDLQNSNVFLQDNIKESISNNQLITDLLSTTKYKPDAILSSISEKNSEKSNLCEINLYESILVNGNSENNINQQISSEYIVNDQSQPVWATVIDAVAVVPTVNEVTQLKNDNGQEVVSSDNERKNVLNNIKQFNEMELKGLSEGTENKSGLECEDYDKIRLPSEIPLPDDDDIENVINSENTVSLNIPTSIDEHITEGHKSVSIGDQLKLNTVENQINLSVDNNELPNNTDIYLKHIGDETVDKTLLTKLHKMEIAVEINQSADQIMNNIKLPVEKEHYSQCIEINQSIEKLDSMEQQNIDNITEGQITTNIDKNSEQVLSECKEQQKYKTAEHIVTGVNVYKNTLSENQENKFVDDNAHITLLEKSSSEQTELYINDNNLNASITEDPNQINQNKELKAIPLMEGNDSGHPNYIHTFDHIGYGYDALNDHDHLMTEKLVSRTLSSVDGNEDIDKIQLLCHEQKENTTVFSNVEDMASNQLIKAEKNNTENDLANTLNNLVAEELTENITKINMSNELNQKKIEIPQKSMEKVRSVTTDLQKDINYFKKSDISVLQATNDIMQVDYGNKIEMAENLQPVLFESIEQVKVSGEIHFVNIEPEFEENIKSSNIQSKDKSDIENIKANNSENTELKNQNVNQIAEELTRFENTKISDLATTEGVYEMGAQDTFAADATLNMNLYQEDELENKDCHVSSVKCNREYEHDLKVESQIENGNVDQKQNDMLRNSQINSELVQSASEGCAENTVIVCNKNFVETHILNVTAVEGAICNHKNDENKKQNTDFSHNANSTIAEENKTLCIADILNSSNKSNKSKVEEVITKISGNNTYHVSLGNNNMESEYINEELENVNKTSAMNTKIVVSPPLSPKISSKGYNFNFDEIDDPFATKIKVCTSPPLEGPPKPRSSVGKFNKNTKPEDIKKDFQRRKSQPVNKKQISFKNKINSTFGGALDITEMEKNAVNKEAVEAQASIPVLCPFSNDKCHVPNDVIPSSLTERDTLVETIEISVCQAEKIINGIEDFTNTRCQNLSISDNTQTHLPLQFDNINDTDKILSAINKQNDLGVESFKGKNVFNLPEMSSDMNFNPFTTKSKVRRSPSPALEVEHSSTDLFKDSAKDLSRLVGDAQKNDSKNIKDLDDIQIADKIELDSSVASYSSKATEDATVREVNTEDEDTVEGPFFETDDFNEADKMSEFVAEHDDMMQFSDIPTHGTDDNADSGEMFIDAEAFEFLLNQNKSNVVADSGKESLFLKFDPLFAKRMSSDGVLAALSKVQKRQSTPKRISKAPTVDVSYCDKFLPEPSNLNVTTEVNNTLETNFEDPNVAVSKPMMVVNPAVNSILSPINRSSTPPRANRRSLTFTSPAIAVIDRLLSLSGNNSTLNHETTITQVRREQNETDLALTQLRELLAEKEIHVHNLRLESKELKERLTALESQVKTLETESEHRLKKVNELNERLAEKTKINKSMAAVVEEYERTIASLIAETEQDKKRHAEERMRLINERDEQTAHLASMEISFNDLHSKYEKSKQIILSCKANEDAYKRSIKEFEESLLKMQNNYELLKQHATSKLNHANQELERFNRAHEAEMLKLSAMIKRKELHITSLEETLTQKTKANEELTAICDELINKVV